MCPPHSEKQEKDGPLRNRTPGSPGAANLIPDADRAAIAAQVQKYLDAKGVDCGEWEIDGRVAALYGL